MSVPYVLSKSWKNSSSRSDIVRSIYKLINGLFIDSIGLIVGGDDIEISTALANNLEFEVLQPDKEEAKRIRKTYGINVVENYFINFQPARTYDWIVALNVLNWKPTDFKNFFENSYKALNQRGLLFISYYEKIYPFAPDKEYLEEIPEKIDKMIKRYNIGKSLPLALYYKDENGKLYVAILNKKHLKHLLNYL